jgi:hypothetical protein
MTEPTRIRLKKKPASQTVVAAVASQAVAAVVADTSVPPVRFEGDRMAVTFDRFDLASYRLFLRCKALPESEVEFHPATESYTLSAPARFAPLLGVTRPAVRESFPLANFAVRGSARANRAQALDCKRFALWCLCGWGKTRLSGGSSGDKLRSAPAAGGLSSSRRTTSCHSGSKRPTRFYGDTLPVVRLRSREQLREWCKHGTVNGEPTGHEACNHQLREVQPGQGRHRQPGHPGVEAPRLRDPR